MLGYFLLFLLAFSAVGNAFAQTYPSKPVRLIVTYPPGAAGAIGMEFAARQPADGYRFVVGNIGPAAVNHQTRAFAPRLVCNFLASWNAVKASSRRPAATLYCPTDMIVMADSLSALASVAKHLPPAG